MNNMLKTLSVAIAYGLLPLSVNAQTFSYDDCVLQGLKGVSSDAAARMIRQSCENKRTDFYRQADKKINDEYGVDDSTSILDDYSKSYSLESGGYASNEYKNISQDDTKLISYVKLSVQATDKNGYCDYSSTKYYSYKTSIKPGSNGSFFFKAPSSKSICLKVASVRTKPYKWSEFSLSSSFKPLDKDPFENTGMFIPAAPAPAAAPAPVPAPTQNYGTNGGGRASQESLDRILCGIPDAPNITKEQARKNKEKCERLGIKP